MAAYDLGLCVLTVVVGAGIEAVIGARVQVVEDSASETVRTPTGGGSVARRRSRGGSVVITVQPHEPGYRVMRRIWTAYKAGIPLGAGSFVDGNNGEIATWQQTGPGTPAALDRSNETPQDGTFTFECVNVNIAPPVS